MSIHEERKRIVSYLRDKAVYLRVDEYYEGERALESAAHAIEKGEHWPQQTEDNASKKIIPTGCVTACKKGTAAEFAVTSYYAAVQTPDEMEDKNQSITLLHVVPSGEKALAFWVKACAESTLLNVLVGGGSQAFVAFMIDAFVQEWKPMEGAEKGYERITLVGKLAYVNAWWNAPHV